MELADSDKILIHCRIYRLHRTAHIGVSICLKVNEGPGTGLLQEFLELHNPSPLSLPLFSHTLVSYLGNSFPGSRFPGARDSRTFSFPISREWKWLDSRGNREQRTAVAGAVLCTATAWAAC